MSSSTVTSSLYLIIFFITNTNEIKTKCGQELTETRGVIQTPDFPKAFPVPIECRWVIDASRFENSSIVVYLTQLYVLTGLTFTDYVYYKSGEAYGGSVRHMVTPENVTSVRSVRTFSQYLVINFTLDRLEGNHLRYLDDKQNVYFMYGFNLTYEVLGERESAKDSCSPKLCSFLGDCYVNDDFSKFGCECFQGYSGPNCSQGPLCEKGYCKNGASCKQVSVVAFTCKCPKGYYGSMCDTVEECEDTHCKHQCAYDGDLSKACKCDYHEPIREDRYRYIIVLSVNKTTALAAGQFNRHLQTYLESKINKYLKKTIKLDHLQILNFKYGTTANFTFHFFASRSDNNTVRRDVYRLAERTKSENWTVTVLKMLSVKQEPTLNIKQAESSTVTPMVGQEFSIYCIAEGSVDMTFAWFKDGVFINESIAMRLFSTHLHSLGPNQYQYSLIIRKAHALDEGKYTCHVSDWGVQQCDSFYVGIAKPPKIKVSPMSSTVERGQSLDIKCIPVSDGVSPQSIGYSWIKNRHLLRMIPGQEVWEDLFISHYLGANIGSVLEITNIQKSATYTCQVQGSGASTEQSVQIEVVNKTVVPLCPAEGQFGVAWPETAPGRETITDCPMIAEGVVRRRCSLININTPQWQLPDFSDCASPAIIAVADNFTRLTLGYQVTTGKQLLLQIYTELSVKSNFMPGESGRTLRLLENFQNYFNQTFLLVEFVESAPLFYKVINSLLSKEYSITSSQQIVNSQKLLKGETAILGSQITAPMHIDLSHLIVDTMERESIGIYNIHYPIRGFSYPPWLSDRVDIYLQTTHVFGNSTFNVNFITYKNLSQYLPARYLAKLSDGTDLEYEINSRLITVEFSRNRFKIDPSGDNFWVDLEIDHFIKDFNSNLWGLKCAVADVVTFDHSWDLQSCTERTYFNATRCHCNKSGTYAVLLVSRAHNPHRNSTDNDHLTVLIGCGCCLVQSVLALGLLLPYWWRHKTCIVYLKLQCCIATISSMAIFVYSVQSTVHKSLYPIITTFLEGLLLIGLSSHISKVLIVYTEIIQLPANRHMKLSVVCVITGVPLLTVLCNYLSHHSTGWSLECWWVLTGTAVFNVFVASIIVMLFLFIFLYSIVIRKLSILSARNNDKNKAIVKRLGLLKRSATIFVAMLLMASCSIFYINVLDLTSEYLFGSTSALLGFVLLFCYALNSEQPFRYKMMKKLKMDSTPDDDFSSESVISPLSFFTKQEGETESEGPAPRRSSTQIRGRELRNSSSNSVDVSEQLLMSETRLSNNEDLGSNTLETYVYSASNSTEEPKTRLFNSEALTPNPYKPMTSFRYHDSEYVEQDVTENWKQKPDVAQCVIKDPLPPPPTTTTQEIVTTRVCVELGVITTHQKSESGQDVDTPAIVLCSVDVEPITRVVEVPEAIAQVLSGESICCNGTSPSKTNEAVATMPPPPEPTPVTEAEDRKQPEGSTTNGGDNLEGMLDRISHDLDYLLNRKPMANGRKSSKLPSNSVRCKIQEEDEETTKS